MKEIETIKALLQQASKLMYENIDNAHNIDLEYMSQRLDKMVSDFDEIGDFTR
jgi:hypothetical protein